MRSFTKRVTQAVNAYRDEMLACLLKSCFGSTDQDMKFHIDHLLTECARYKKIGINIYRRPRVPIPLAPAHCELDHIEFMQKSFDNSGQFPSFNYFCTKFPEYSHYYDFTNAQKNRRWAKCVEAILVCRNIFRSGLLLVGYSPTLHGKSCRIRV